MTIIIMNSNTISLNLDSLLFLSTTKHESAQSEKKGNSNLVCLLLLY